MCLHIYVYIYIYMYMMWGAIMRRRRVAGVRGTPQTLSHNP